MNPTASEDFLPLVEVDTWKLKAFTENVNKGRSELQLPEVHPIYFFSKKLNVRNLFKPNVVRELLGCSRFDHHYLLRKSFDGIGKKSKKM